MEKTFYKMQDYPEQEAGEGFSKTVLVFSEDEDTPYGEIGYYDFEEKQWHIFGDFSLKLMCWCYMPNPISFIKSNTLEGCFHAGYRP